MENYRYQIASDVQRDGLGLELITDDYNIVAEVFRSDKEKTLTFRCFSEAELPLSIVEQMLEIAKRELEPFEDGSLLIDAKNYKHIPPRKTGLGRTR